MPPATDKFSTLPDAILCSILSKIPVKEAIRSSLLSKRWRFLYTQIPHLILSPHLLLAPLHPHLTLCDSPQREIPPPALFSCTRLITLTLYNYILSPLPPHFSGFNHLTTCNFNYVELTDHSLAHFISHCPLLRNLSLQNCVGLQQPAISASNITDLIVYKGVEALTVDCPKLNNLQVYLIKDLRVNGILFHEISCSIWELNMQGGSNLIVLRVESLSEEYTAERFIDIIGSFKLLKLLLVFVGPLLKSEKEMDISLLNVFERLPYLEELYMGNNFLSELANHAIPLTLNSPLSNLRKIVVYIHLDGTSDREICVLGCLLQSTPALQEMVFRTDYADSESPMCTWFLEKVLYLNRASKQARIVAM